MLERDVQWQYPESPQDVLCHYPVSFVEAIVQDTEQDLTSQFAKNLSLLSEKSTFRECSVSEIQTLIDLHDRYCRQFQKADDDVYIDSFLQGCLTAKLKIELLQQTNIKV